MAEISKQALKVDNNQSFPNNNNGAITPSILRAFNTNMIDSMVDEIGYTADSSSWNQQIDALEGFTSSFSTSSFVSTGSFNTYTSSTNSRLNNIESTTASLLIETQNLELFSASALVSISNLNASSASQQVSINALNSATSSYVTETESGSFLITASFDNGTRNLTFTKGNNTTFNVNIPDVSGSTGNFVTTSSFNAYTSSNDSKVNSLINATASYANSASVASVDAAQQSQIDSLIAFTGSNTNTSLNAYTQSNDTKWSNLGGQTGSFITESETASFARTNVDNNFTANQTFTNITAVSASFTYVQTLYETSSVIYSSGSNQFGDELSDIQTLSGSVKVQGSLTVNGTPVLTSSVDISGLTTTASFNAYTQSNDQRVSALEVNSASVNTSITNINSATASLFTSASLGLVTASFDNGTRNLTFTKGNTTQFSVNIPDASGSAGDFVTTSSFNSYTASNDQKVNSLIAATGSYATTGSNTFNGNQIIATGSFQMPNGFSITAASGDVTNLSAGTTIQFITEPPAGPGGTNDIKFINRVTGSSIEFNNQLGGAGNPINFIGGAAGFTLNAVSGSTGKLNINAQGGIDATNSTFTASLAQGYVWVGDASGRTSLVATSSFGGGGNFATTGSNSFDGNQIITGSVTISGSATSDLTVVGQIFVSSSATGGTTAPKITVSGSAGSSTINRNSIQTRNGTDSGGIFPSTLYTQDSATFDEIGFTVDTSVFSITGWSTGPAFYINNTALDTYPAVFGFQNKANYTDGRVAVLTPLSASAGFTASLQNGYAWVGNSLGQNTQVATSSFGTAINTGSFATTGSNTFIGNQIINGGLIVSSSSPIGFSGSSFIVDTFDGGGAITFRPGTSINFFGNTNFTSPIRTTIVNVDNSGSNGYYGFNAETEGRIYQDFSGSVNARINAAAVSGGAAISVQDEGSILGTASSFNFNGAGVTATVSAGTASITIPGGGGSIDTGSFATTGSNTFTGDQTINNTSGFTNLALNNSTQNAITLEAPNNYLFSAKGPLWIGNYGAFGGSGSMNITATSNSINLGADDGIIIGRTLGGNPDGSGAVKMNTTSGSLVLAASTYNNTAATLLHLSSSNTTFVNLIFKNNNTAADTIISGSNNIFTNPAAVTTGYKRYIGGSNNLYLNATNGINSQITASAISVSGVRPIMNNNIFNGTGNFAINQATNPGTHTYSQNIIAGTGGVTTINALAFTGSLNFLSNFNNNGTITINAASASVTEIAAGLSGSGTFTMSGNGNFGGTMTITSPRILSTSGVQNTNNNVIAGGSITVTNISSSLAVAATGNLTNGAISYTNAAASAIHTSAGNVNTIQGGITVNAIGSAVAIANVITLGAPTITNNSFSGSAGGGQMSANRNLFQGQAHTITVTGSQDAGTTTNANFSDNTILGKTNTIFSNLTGAGNYRDLNASVIGGQNLIVSASNSFTLTEGGGAYFGRWNADDGRRNKTGENVFLVGTGNSTTRKTGFLIDSGSNTFIEGTLNVSGSTTLSGSLYIQSGSTLPSATGSSILTWNPTTGQVSQSPIATLISSSFSVGAFNSTVTQSGSAAVSQSMTFNNTDISNGVSIVSNSQITLANTGTYNIQFSAQLLAGTGADTIWIWLKKNGTNVSNTGTKLVLANNEASVAAWNFVVPAVASDYFELVWQSLDGHATLLTEAASGNYPAIPSIIVTVTQVE